MGGRESVSFGRMLRQYREAAGFTQEELAERAGLSVNAVGSLERGQRRQPLPDTVRRLAAALELTGDARAALVAAARQPPGGSASPAPTFGLPAPVTPLIGRDREVAEVRQLLTEARLVTLTGVGGAGKTRLALAVAEASRLAFPGGVAFVNLAPIDDHQQVPLAIAHAIGADEPGPTPPFELIVRVLGTHRVLLVLDNFEQVLEAAPVVSRLLAATPGLRVLATSRALLRLYGEHEYRVPPLSLPNDEQSIERSEAVRLFVQAARAARPGFALDATNRAAVAAICARLDGLPLAVELAAARTRLFTPNQLLARLTSRLAVLTGERRGVPARQQTLRQTFDWSYALLPSADQRLLATLGVCAGGFTMEAVVALWPEGDPTGDIVAGLESLHGSGLIERAEETEQGPRFRMLETVREYALARLAERGETELAERRHSAFFCALAEQGRSQLRGGAVSAWLDLLEADHDNLRVALRRAIDREAAELAQRLVGALARFWVSRGYPTEGQRWAEEALAIPGPVPPAIRAGALDAAGLLAVDCRQLDLARAHLMECLELRRALGDRRGTAETLATLASALALGGDNRGAIALLEESLRLHRQSGYRWGIAIALNNLADKLTNEGNDTRAEQLLEEAIAIWEALSDRGGLALSLATLAEIALARDDYDRALARFGRSLTQARAAGARNLMGTVLSEMALTRVRAGDLVEARQALREAIEQNRAMSRQTCLVVCLLAAAELAAAEAAPARAVRLLAAAEALRARLGATPKRVERTYLALDRRSSPSLEAAWTEGWGMALDQALAEALRS